MEGISGHLREVLDQELALHRELLAIARLRHMVLRQGRVAALYALQAAEAARVTKLRRLEAVRKQLADAADGQELAAISPRIAETIRRLGAVERANRSLLARHVVRARHLADGVAGWAAP